MRLIWSRRLVWPRTSPFHGGNVGFKSLRDHHRFVWVSTVRCAIGIFQEVEVKIPLSNKLPFPVNPVGRQPRPDEQTLWKAGYKLGKDVWLLVYLKSAIICGSGGMADAPVLEAGAFVACGFKSHLPHQKRLAFMIGNRGEKYECKELAVYSFRTGRVNLFLFD